jgi:hypothetical protein
VTAPIIQISEAVTIEVTKLKLSEGDILWVKVAADNPLVHDWETMHMIQHSLQDVVEPEHPGVLVIVAPGDVEPVVLSSET